MAIYYVLLLTILLLGLLFYCITKSSCSVVFLALTTVILFVMMALRSQTVGQDVDIYYNLFQSMRHAHTLPEILNIVYNAPIYCLLSKLFTLYGDFRLLMVFMALVITLSVAVYIYNYSRNYVFSMYCFVSLFFYLHTYNISRQFLAIAFTLYALCFLKHKHLFCTVLCMLLAVGTHSTTILAIPILLLSIYPITIRTLQVSLFVTGGLGIFFNALFPILIQLFVTLFPRYQVYISSNVFTTHSVYDQSSGAIVYLNLFYLCVVCVAFLLQSNHIKSIGVQKAEQTNLRFLIATVLIGTVAGITLGHFEAMTRALYVYQIHTICLIPNTIESMSRKRYIVFLYYLLIFLLLVPFTICLMRNFGEVVPYQIL